MPRPTDVHRMMIQTFMSRRHVPEEVAKELYKRCVRAVQIADPSFTAPHQISKGGTRTLLQECSSILEAEDLWLEIRELPDEERQGKAIYVLVNTDGSEESRAMSDYEPLQISYFRELVDAIITSYPANSVGSNQALNLASKLKGTLTKTAAGNLLKSFVARGWLSKSKRGRYALGARAIAELEGWLFSEYEDLMERCARCQKTVLSGVICSNDDCKCHIHGSCYAILQEAVTPKCPSCKQTFDEHPPTSLGEKAVSQGEDDFGTIRGKRKRPSRVEAAELESEEEDDLEYAPV